MRVKLLPGLVLAILAFSATPALAVLRFSHQVKGYGEPPVEFTSPAAVAVNAGGDVYIASGKAVDEFGPSGESLRQLTGWIYKEGTPEAEVKAFGKINGIALDAAGDLYVASALPHVVDEFSPSGKSLEPQLQGTVFNEETGEWEGFGSLFGVAVDNSSAAGDTSKGDVYVADPGEATVQKFSAAGAYLPPNLENVGEPKAVAVDASGDVYVSDAAGKVLDEFSPAGVLLGQLTGAATEAKEFGEPRGVAIGPQGEVFVADAASKVIDEFAAPGEPFTETLTTEITGNEPPLTGFEKPVGVGVDAKGDLYVADSEAKAVDVFDDVAAPNKPKTAAPNPLTATTATLHGTLEPAGAATEFYFAYNLTGAGATCTSTGSHATPVDNGGAPATGTGVEAESAAVTGLQPNAQYTVCLVAKNAIGTTVGSEIPFTTAKAPPTIASESTPALGLRTATLQAQVNPNNQEVTECRFQYVAAASYDASAPDPYGAGASLPCEPAMLLAGFANEPEDASLAGLAANTTYHYRVIVKNASGEAEQGPDQTFATQSLTPAVLSGPAEATPGGERIAATVNPEGQDTTYHLEYGTSFTGSSFDEGASVPATNVDIGAGYTAEAVAATVTGLQSGATYYYRVVAVNAAGVAVSDPQAFRTPPALPLLSTGGSSGVTQTTGFVTGTLNPEGSETTYEFQYGPTPALGEQAPGTPIDAGASREVLALEIALVALQSGAPCFYRLVAENAAGIVYGALESFTTAPAPLSIVQEPPLLAPLVTAPPKTTVTKTTKPKSKKKKKPKPKKGQKSKKKGKAKR